MIALAFLLATATPSAEALALGRQIAESGTLGALLPMMQAKETDELLAAHPDLSTAEQATLRRAAETVYDAGYARIMDAEGRAIAERLSIVDLRIVATFTASDAGKRYKAALPSVIGATVKALGEMHYKEDVAAEMCRQSGKLCAKKP